MYHQLTSDGDWVVSCKKYTLTLSPREALGKLVIEGTHQRHFFFLGGACNVGTRQDETIAFGEVFVQSNSNGLRIEIPQKSNLWNRKRFVCLCGEEYLEFFIEIEGHGALESVYFLRGFFNGEERGMSSDIDEIYSTAPNFQERLFFAPGDSFGISAGDYLEMPVGAQALASPCYCMGLHDRRDAGYLSVGLATRPGNWTWDVFQWNPPVTIPVTGYAGDNALAGGFAAIYNGKEIVNGAWESPHLILAFAKNREDVLGSHLEFCYQAGWLPRPEPRPQPAWWLEPIYCTWHDQSGLAASEVGFDPQKINSRAQELCTQELCEHWVNLLAEKNCKPGTVILDATWAIHLNSGEPDSQKWDDLRGWIECCHERGIRVFIWALAWAIEGLPIEECMTRDDKPVACDITNPDYVARFREMIRRWFSNAPDCLNADGVKLDGQLNLPTGRNLKNTANLWGLELQHLYLKILHTEAKKHNPEACISTFSLHPYLAEFTDMVRLADLYTHRPTARVTMQHRAALYRQTMPHTAIDTDGNIRFCATDDFISEFEAQASEGIPSLYAAEWAWRARWFQPARLEKFRDADYAAFSKIFAEYKKREHP